MEQLQPGEVLEGRYRIDSLLASGGQAHVYRGSHLGLGRDVAVKVLKNDFTDDVRIRMARRFEQEARLISQLRDPHTITLYDFGTLLDGSMFMVFEFIDGLSLRELVEAEGAIDGARVHKILTQTLLSLQEAHAFGVLHRDLKPQNIMVYEHAGRRDQIKLLDFGIAKIMRDDRGQDFESLTNANSVVGTPRYLAPEIFQDGKASSASDIYSLGLVAYELLVTKPAILGATPFDIVRNSTRPEPIRIPQNAPVNDTLRALIERMLDKNVSRRFSSADDVLRELEGCPTATPTHRDLDLIPEIAFEPLDDDIPDSGAPSHAPFASPSTSEHDRGFYHTPAHVSALTDAQDIGIVTADEFASMRSTSELDAADAPTAMVSPRDLSAAGFLPHLDADEDYEPTELSDLSSLDFGSVSDDDLDMLAGELGEDSNVDGDVSEGDPATQILSDFDVSSIVSQDEYEPTQLSSLSGLDLDEAPTQSERIREGIAAARAAMSRRHDDDVADAKTERLDVLPSVYADAAVLRRPRRRKKPRRSPKGEGSDR